MRRPGKLGRGLSRTARIMIAALVGLFAAFLVAGLCLGLLVASFERPGAYALGLAAGTAVSIIKVVLMERGLNRIADMGEAGEHGGARAYGTFQVVLRNMLTLALFAAAFLFRAVIGPWGAITGTLALQLSAYITGYALRRESAKI